MDQSNSQQLLANGLQEINTCESIANLEAVRVAYFGKKGHLTNKLQELQQLPPEKKRELGQALNKVKQDLLTALNAKKEVLEKLALDQELSKETIDVTLAGRNIAIGRLHPISLTINDFSKIFSSIGFKIFEGPEIETEYFNFTALNTPEDHPARDMHDTFYLDLPGESNNKYLLRSHTSPSQIHAVKSFGVPLRVLVPGKAYRCDSDLTHTPMFHQIEGLMIDDRTNFADLKTLLHDFLKIFFQRDDLKIRFRASFFPFTEPSAEVDISCIKCNAKGCRICKNTGWLEVMGCGMVHPNVLSQLNIDSNKYLGFAFGGGVERFAMLRYGIPDIRLNFVNDLRFLKQFF